MEIGFGIQANWNNNQPIIKLVGKIDALCLKYFESKQYSPEQVTSFYIRVICFDPAISTFEANEFITGFYTGARYIKNEKSFNTGFHVNFTEVQQAKDAAALLEIFTLGLKSIYSQLSKEKFKDFAFETFWNDLMQFTEELPELLSKYVSPVTPFIPEYNPTLATQKFTPKAFTPQNPRSDAIRVKFQDFKSKPKFVKQAEGIMYPEPSRPELLLQMTSLINKAADDFIEVIKGPNTETAYQEKIEQGLSRFDPLMLDTEDRQKVCIYFEELMDIVGLQSSGGKLNTWMYGFDPSDLGQFTKE